MSSNAAVKQREDRFGAERLAGRAARLSAQCGGATALDILHHAINVEFSGRIAMVSSFGAESAALLHLIAKIDRKTPIKFLDTGKHFAQTLSYRKKLARELGLTDVVDIRPDAGAIAAHDREGNLWRSNPDACCTLRKVRPLERALEGLHAWITGRKQFHGGARINLPVFEAAAPFIKVNPIVRWSADDVKDYISEHGLSAHPLIEHGYPSIGCWPCTHPVSEGEDARAGRWRGAAKTECGIHQIGVGRPGDLIRLQGLGSR